MVRITEDLVRKKSEHNECIISTLEELSLHQEDIEKIEHLNNWCKNLQILYLQANLISKIENLNKLKNLQYLNLALNNIEKIENLERCESLQKLDLTLNFIGDVESVCSLRKNVYLRDFYLTGNPCCAFEGYREYVIVNLPQIERLDNTVITKSERIKARQIVTPVEPKIQSEETKIQSEETNIQSEETKIQPKELKTQSILPKILLEQLKYKQFRQDQKERLKNPNDHLSDEEFWKTASENSPETRVEIARRSRKCKGKDDGKGQDESSEKMKKSLRLFHKDGRPLNINEGKFNFNFSDEDPKELVLDVAVYKYLDTNLIDVDVQPIFVKIKIKGKIFQMVLPEEVFTDRSVAQRSQTTGHLVIRMPRVNWKETKGNCKETKGNCIETKGNSKETKENGKETKEYCKMTKTKEYLEIKEKDSEMDFSKIVGNKNVRNNTKFVDNSEVPPLEYAF